MKVMQVGVLGFLFLIGILACGVFSNSVTSNPTLAPATDVSVIPTMAPLPTQELNAIPTQVPLAQPTQAITQNSQTFTITESDLNRQLSQNIPQNGQVSNVYLDLHPGNTANLSATVNVNSFTLQPNATLQVTVANGRITINVTQVNVGGFGVPQSMIEPQIADLKNTAERELNAQLATLEKNTGMKLQSITTTENDMTLYFAK